ncbi:hypothetical protein GRH90_19955 [Enterobacteriales bacterium SAP-6]|uniref:Helix-hairpin-helix DNA-binding motif class 1 domain-containing protein n=2 Tax=Acerihabitans arboris TaxID=2691583 RepID=A0A845SR22_9GAMM|nr:hypothetical protein [Acerihabitans arboris]
MAWCSDDKEVHVEEPIVISLDTGNNKAIKVPADGGGAIGIGRDITAAGDGADKSGGDKGGDTGGKPVAQSIKPAVETQDKSTQTDDFGAEKVNINTATAEELVDALKGIGPKKAQAIIDYREAKGPFTQVEQLKEVKGIGPSTLSNIKELVTLE